MAVTVGKRKRVSKKSKLSWRKHSKVADIEEFLEEQREDERLGGPLDQISDDQLFTLDTKPDETLISTRQQRKLKALRPLKGFAALQPHTNVPDPIKKRNRVRTVDERRSVIVKQKELENRKKNILKAKEVNAIAERRLNEIKRENKEKPDEFLHDIWNKEVDLPIKKDQWAEPITKVHNLRNLGIPVKRTLKDLSKKKSILPAVEVPHPGMSYNPSFKDHQNLIKEIAEAELKVIKDEEHVKRVTRDIFRKVLPKQKESEWLIEMSEGLMKVKDEIDIKEEYEDLDKISVNPPVQNKKKTLKQRRKQKEQLALEKKLKAKKMEKKKIGDIHKLKVLQKHLEHMGKKQEKLQEIRKIRQEKDRIKPKTLGSTKFEDLGPDFQMGEDISGNLRGLKKEGNLLLDRFKSLQKRNILVPSKRAHKKKNKVKKYTKPGHKEDWEKTVAKTGNVAKRK
ncbi:hypothetical protein ABEB36_006599 [Hypothenemus hampei]|uniref:Ribosome biogenesis protein NOP53 n=1 Tax=Hypothenemus hampei TaxID=57062 RepID=A0ABD1ERU9_HYPHA